MRALIVAGAALGYVAGGAAHAQDQSGQCRSREAASPLTREIVRGQYSGQIWAQANGAARQRPEISGFSAARYVYTYEQGAIFELYANPNFISTILLEEGETLQDVAAGDTSRWTVTQAMSAGALAPRPILLVKPQTPGLRTNLVLVTDRRIYLVEAISHARDAYSAEIAWCYPEAQNTQNAPSDIATLNFNYRTRVTRGRRPAWIPSRVFDDGRRTWVEFDEDVEAGALPPLFVLTGEGAELTNFRFDGRRYVVDRVFDAAELRLGVRAQTIVRIERDPRRRP